MTTAAASPASRPPPAAAVLLARSPVVVVAVAGALIASAIAVRRIDGPGPRRVVPVGEDGIVVAVSGEARPLGRGAARGPLCSGRRLVTGDRVALASGASVSVLESDGTLLRLGRRRERVASLPRARRAIGGLTVPARPPRRPPVRDGAPTVLWPVHEAVRSRTGGLDVAWLPSAKDATYDVLLDDRAVLEAVSPEPTASEGGRPFVRAELPDAALAAIEREPGLVHALRVVAHLQDGKTAKGPEAIFRLLNPERRDRLAAVEVEATGLPDERARAFILGAAFLEARVTERALLHLEAAERLTPDDPGVLLALARAFGAAGIDPWDAPAAAWRRLGREAEADALAARGDAARRALTPPR